MKDPFRHHPELASLVMEPSSSSMREMSPAKLGDILRQHDISPDCLLSDADRESSRRRTLDRHDGGDLWVFAYGSLMWNPAIHFTEVRRAHVPGYERQFILRDTLGGRGTPDRPGLMAALDEGKGCDGLVFCISEDLLEDETEVLWRRERIVPAYHSTFLRADTAEGPVSALAFVADHNADLIDERMSWEDKVSFCATGSGFMGTSFDYFANLATHFEALGIEDASLVRLLEEARAYQNSQKQQA